MATQAAEAVSAMDVEQAPESEAPEVIYLETRGATEDMAEEIMTPL